jgi:hypothetical protein
VTISVDNLPPPPSIDVPNVLTPPPSPQVAGSVTMIPTFCSYCIYKENTPAFS